jgi:hypothetical protein
MLRIAPDKLNKKALPSIDGKDVFARNNHTVEREGNAYQNFTE